MKSNILFMTMAAMTFLYACKEEMTHIEGHIDDHKNALPYYHTPDFQPIWNPENPDTIHTIPSFSLVDQLGDSIGPERFNHTVYVANFFFTNCGGICPKMMRNMAYLQENTDINVKFISHSVLPEQDSVAQLKLYANNFGVDEQRWHLVTGHRGDIYDLARKGYFAEESIGYNKDSTEFLHTEHFMLVDQVGHLRGIYNGTLQLEMDRIIEDVQLLLVTEQ